MNELTIQLSYKAYQKLLSLCQSSGMAPEKWVTERINKELVFCPGTPKGALDIARRFMESRVGFLLVPKKATLDMERNVWRIAVFANVNVPAPPFVGEVQVDALTGDVRTPVEEISGMMRIAEASLGMELFPMEKQERLKALRFMNTEGKLNFTQQEELRRLVLEAERQTHENLQRWQNLVCVPKGNENEFQHLMNLADTMEEQVDA